jgi:hypothetical protein
MMRISWLAALLAVLMVFGSKTVATQLECSVQCRNVKHIGDGTTAKPGGDYNCYEYRPYRGINTIPVTSFVAMTMSSTVVVADVFESFGGPICDNVNQGLLQEMDCDADLFLGTQSYTECKIDPSP